MSHAPSAGEPLAGWRSRLRPSSEDLRFLLHLGGWMMLGAIAAGLMRPVEAFGIDDLPPGFARSPVRPPERVRMMVALPSPPERSAPSVEAPGEAEAPAPERRGPARARAGSADEAEAEAEPLTLAARLIGTRGTSSSALVTSLWGDDPRPSATSEALGSADAVEEAPSGLRSGRGAGGPARGGDLPRIGPGGGPASPISVQLLLPDPPARPDRPKGPAGPPSVSMKERVAALRYCYEKRLMLVPGLGGRIELVLGGGGPPRLAADTTGDEDLVRCVMSAARRWDLGEISGFGEVTVPVVFRPDP